jgi:hypothetical protein
MLIPWAASGFLLLPHSWLHYLSVDAFAAQYHPQALLCFVGVSVFLSAYPIQRLGKSVDGYIEFRRSRRKLAKTFKIIDAKHIGGKVGVPTGLFYQDDSTSPHWRLAVVGFRNESLSSRKLQSPEVIAQIRYFDHRGREVANAPAGVWLGKYGELNEFTPGHDNWLIVYAWNKHDDLMRVWNRSYYHSSSWMGNGPSFEVCKESDGCQDVATIEIKLLAGSLCFKVFRLEVDMNGKGLPQLRARRHFSFLRRN